MNVALMEMHRAHKERQARIAARAYQRQQPVIIIDEPVIAPVVQVEEEIQPIPVPQREPWFRILSLTSPMIRDIQDVVAEFYGITYTDLVSSRRTMPLVLHRQVAMYLAKEITGKSLPEIGRRFGGRDHTTVLHAVRKVQTEIKTDHELQDEITEIKYRLEAL